MSTPSHIAATGDNRETEALTERFQEWLQHWGGRLIKWSAGLLLAGALGSLLATLAFSGRVVGGPKLETATNAEQFIAELKRQNGGHWPEAKQSVPPGRNSVGVEGTPAAQQHRDQQETVNLFHFRIVKSLDSFLIVPGYMLLFLMEYLVLALCLPRRKVFVRLDRWPAASEIALHLACFVPVAAGLLDLAENVVTLNAAEDAVSAVLADETVADLHIITTCKWALLGLSALILGVLAWPVARLQATGPWLLKLVFPASLATAVAFAVFLLQPMATWAMAFVGLPVALGGGAWACLRMLKTPQD